eukprot:5980289-Pyramimonas_sp.AAC.1
MVIKFDGSQKLRMAYKVLPEDRCVASMTQIAQDICSGKLTLDEAKAKRKQLVNDFNQMNL